MRKILFQFILLSFISTPGFAQQFSLNQKLLIHLGYSTIKSNSSTDPDFGDEVGGEPNSKFSGELGYKIFPVFSLSGYIAYSQIRVNHFEGNAQTGFTASATTKKSNFYGINARFHCLPLFNKEDKMRFDVYMIGTIGMVKTSSMELISDEWQEIYEVPFWERGVGLGLSYNFTKNIGVFGEYQVGKFYNDRKSQWKAGVLVKF